MNSGLMPHQQQDHTEMGPWLKVSSKRPEKRGINLAIPGLVVWRVIHYTTTSPKAIMEGSSEVPFKRLFHIKFSLLPYFFGYMTDCLGRGKLVL